MIFACGIAQYKEKFLFFQRLTDVPYGGRWEFPAVAIDGEDSAEEALERDFFERSGLRIEKMEPLGSALIREVENSRMLFFRIFPEKIFVTPCSVLGYARSRWIAPRSATRYPLMSFCVTFIKSQKFYGKFV